MRYLLLSGAITQTNYVLIIDLLRLCNHYHYSNNAFYCRVHLLIRYRCRKQNDCFPLVGIELDGCQHPL